MTKLRILALTYKTFPATLPTVQEATVDVLKRMGMRVSPQRPDDGSTRILASGWRRQVDVELEARGMEETRARIVARDGVFFEENAASDLVAQVTRRLEHHDKSPTNSQPANGKTAMAIMSTCPVPTTSRN